MMAILNSLNVHNFHIFQLILMKLVSKFMVYRALSDKLYFIIRVAVPFKSSELAAYLSMGTHVSSANINRVNVITA